MSAAPDPVLVRSSEPETLDRATVVALDANGSIVGRASLSRLYGMRAEIQLELAPTTTVTLALIDALELEAVVLSDSTVAALRRWRPIALELRASHTYLTWSTTPVNS
jgi:hypothetical protein